MVACLPQGPCLWTASRRLASAPHFYSLPIHAFKIIFWYAGGLAYLKVPVLGLQVVIMLLPPIYTFFLESRAQALQELLRGFMHPSLQHKGAQRSEGAM